MQQGVLYTGENAASAELGQIIRSGFNLETNPDVLIPLRRLGVQPQKPAKVDITVKLRLDLFDLNAAHSRMGDHTGRYTSRQRIEQVFDGIGALVGSAQSSRFVGMQVKRMRVGLFAAEAVKTLHASGCGREIVLRARNVLLPNSGLSEGLYGLSKRLKINTIGNRMCRCSCHRLVLPNKQC